MREHDNPSTDPLRLPFHILTPSELSSNANLTTASCWTRWSDAFFSASGALGQHPWRAASRSDAPELLFVGIETRFETNYPFIVGGPRNGFLASTPGVSWS